MGSTRRFRGRGKDSSAQGGAANGKKVVVLDPSRRPTAKQLSMPPKRPRRPTPRKSTIVDAIKSAIAYLLKTSRGLRTRKRGTEPSGKRRA